MRKTAFGDTARNDTKDCGGVMRVAPVGLFAATPAEAMPPNRALDWACELAGLTHGHPTGQLTAGVLATTIREAALAAAGPSSRDQAITELGGGWVAEEAFAIAVFCARVANVHIP